MYIEDRGDIVIHGGDSSDQDDIRRAKQHQTNGH
jgi:6-phosphogluconate dehydrogenase (decarboxylating)